MKKTFCVIITLFLVFPCIAQNIIQVTNNDRNNSTTPKECEYRINGICSSEDIGGVDVDITYDEADHTTYAVFKNYNKCSVSVLYEIGNSDDGEGSKFNTDRYRTEDGKTGSMVLVVNGTKKIKLDYHKYTYPYADMGCLYYDHSNNYSIKGIIVRKVKN